MAYEGYTPYDRHGYVPKAKDEIETIVQMIQAIGDPPDSSFADPEAGLDTAPAVVAEPTSPAFQTMVNQAALPGQVVQQVAQTQPIAPVYGPAPPPAAAAPAAAAPVFQYVDQSGIVHTFDSQAKLNDFIANLGKAEISAPATAALSPKTFQAFNAVTGEYEGAYPTQAAADIVSMEWAETKRRQDEMLRIDEDRLKIDQVVELGTGEEPMAAWEDWSTAFGAYSPEQQYNALMRQQLPQYGIPGYGQMAQQQFAPTFGRFLMSGYGDDPVSYGLGSGQGFEKWFGGQMGRRPDATSPATGQMPWTYGTAYPTTGTQTPNLNAGWQLAQQFGALQPESLVWDQLMGQNLGMGYAMTQPDAIQAMAQSQYYGGGGPVGGYAGRAVASGLSGLYDRWMQRQLAGSGAAPAAFLPYLSSLSKTRWPTLTTPYEYVEPDTTTTSDIGVIA
jgi:hypothetical protein